jgi:major membrane immunogen (membrane-anchored lipoprotein)
MRTLRTIRFSVLTFGLATAMASSVLLGGCGSDTSAAVGGSTDENTVVSVVDTAADSEKTVPQETVAGTTTATGEPGTVASLATDSPTCEAFATVKRLNDETGVLTAELQGKLLEVVSVSSGDAAGSAGSVEAIEKEFAAFLEKFNESAKVSVPQLQEAYKTLAREQPQFKTELAAVEDVTVKAIQFFGSMDVKKLNTFQEDLIEALGMETVTAAGAGTLKIDAFSRQACNLTFANS